MVGAYVSVAMICLGSLLVGRAVMCLLGRREQTWLEASVGLAVLLIVCAVAIRRPGEGSTAAVTFAGTIAIACLVLLVLRAPPLPRPLLSVGGPAALITLLLASIPFIVSGRVAPLGVGVNNDLVSHLDWAAWLQNPIDGGREPIGLETGYPIGPHALVGAITAGTDFAGAEVFVGLVISLPILIALTAPAALERLTPGRRVLGAVFVALPYMAAATLSIGGFKELALALFVVAFAIGLRSAIRDDEGRLGLVVALAVMLAGVLFLYSGPGLLWAGLTALLTLIAFTFFGQAGPSARRLVAGVRRAAVPLAAGLLVLVAIGYTQWDRITEFIDESDWIISASGRLKQSVSPFEALGPWPSLDFLAGFDGPAVPYLFALLGLAGVAVAIAWLGRRREPTDLVLISAFGAVALVYAYTVIWGGFYVQQKALAVAGPTVMLVAVAGLLARPSSTARTVLAVAFIAVSGYSSFLALREAPVLPLERSNELDRIRERVQGANVLAFTTDRATDYHLRGAVVMAPARFADRPIEARQSKRGKTPLDFDSVRNYLIDDFDFALTTSADFASAPPDNWREVERTKSFVLWKRFGPTERRAVLPEQQRPGTLLECKPDFSRDKPYKLVKKYRKILRHGKALAVVAPRPPVIGKRVFWQPEELLQSGEEARQTLKLPPGRWDISIQYYSTVLDIDVRVGDRKVTLPATADGTFPYKTDLGPFWPVMEYVSGGGPVEVSVRAGDRNLLQTLLGVKRPVDLGSITAYRRGDLKTIPFEQACGRYVDHYLFLRHLYKGGQKPSESAVEG